MRIAGNTTDLLMEFSASGTMHRNRNVTPLVEGASAAQGHIFPHQIDFLQIMGGVEAYGILEASGGGFFDDA